MRWERMPNSGTHVGVNAGFAVWNADDHAERGYFKYPSANEFSSSYSIGMERVGYTIASALGFPVKPTYLEEVDGQAGALTLWIPGVPWSLARDEVRAGCRIADQSRWPTYVALDVLLGVIDRKGSNIHIEWNPPDVEKQHDEEKVCTTWLLDYGFSGLWPPGKFDERLTAADLENLNPDADIADASIEMFRKVLPVMFRQAWHDADRAQVLDELRGISEDHLEAAVREIPSEFITAKAADLTVRFFAGRLGRLDKLLDGVFPP
jgi:hypothetical protein